MTRPSSLALLVAACLLAQLQISGCQQDDTHVREFATAAVAVAPLIDSVLATGRVRTVSSVDVSSQLSGRIDEVYVDYNDIVSSGDPLARLDPQRFQSRVEELEAALAVAQAELLSLEASLAGAQAKFEEDNRDYQRKLDLSRNGSVSESALSQARSVKLQSESGLRTLAASKEIKMATISAAKASLRQAQIDLDRTTIRAPISGIVIKRSIEPGQTVAVSLSAPELFTIANDLSQIEVHARVDEADIGKVRSGQPVNFTVDAYTGQRFEGTVSQIRKAPEISQNVVVYSVVISASNPEEQMLPGMTALVEIITARKDEVLQVPNAALRFEMGPWWLREGSERSVPDSTKPGVWVVARNGDYDWKSLEIGYTDGEFSEVRAGDIEAGNRVIVGYR
jgi:HlyD family secretion protein